jgi:hypothetical protein
MKKCEILWWKNFEFLGGDFDIFWREKYAVKFWCTVNPVHSVCVTMRDTE